MRIRTNATAVDLFEISEIFEVLVEFAPFFRGTAVSFLLESVFSCI